MKLTETSLAGMFVVEAERFADERGAFEAPWLRDELEHLGLETAVAQASLSTNHRRGTLRGMHFQAAPYEEVKIIRVIRGAAFDVGLDLRSGSPTFGKWHGVELSAANRRMVYLPRGFAHGYQTLADDTELLYFVSAPYMLSHQRGVRWNDAGFNITWPLPSPSVISPRDAAFPDFKV
jgi:dTDP-4-dehydrorhamnose 3,5-epimerase